MGIIVLKTVKQKACKICRKLFSPFSTTSQVCSIDCAREYANKKRIAKERTESMQERRKLRERKEAIKPRSELLKDAQRWFNCWVRKRDEGLNCIACDKPMLKKINASHYRSVGANPEIRFEPLNCHAGCEACNTFLSGNILNYRINLIKRIGIEKVEWLEGKQDPKHYTLDEIKAIKAKYKSLCYEMEKKNG